MDCYWPPSFLFLFVKHVFPCCQENSQVQDLNLLIGRPTHLCAACSFRSALVFGAVSQELDDYNSNRHMTHLQRTAAMYSSQSQEESW